MSKWITLLAVLKVILPYLCLSYRHLFFFSVGVFTGYSSLTIALALPDDGKVIACDINTDFTDIGKPFWKEAGVDGKIDLRIAPATETLR